MLTRLFVAALLLGGCATTQIEYPSVCLPDDENCKRNLNARTLKDLGHGDAATALMCSDPDVHRVLSECHTRAGYSW